MKSNYIKLKRLIKDVIFVSKATKTKNKKLRIFSVVVLSNLTAASDIGIILIFTSIITNSFQSTNPLSFLVQFFIDFKIFIPLLVCIRFLFVFGNSIIMKKLEFEITENLRTYFLDEIFDRSNYSISDAYFYINTLTGHVTFFYAAFTGALNGLIQFFAYSAYLLVADPLATTYFIGGILILYYPLKKITTKTRSFTNEVYWKSFSVSNEIEKLIENIYLIKVLKKDKEEINNFDTLQKNLNRVDLKKTIYNSASGFLPTFLTMLVLSVLVSFPRIVVSLTLDFIAVTLRLFQSLGVMSNSINSLLNSQIHIDKFIEFSKSNLRHNEGSFTISANPKNKNAVVMKNVSFQYANNDINIFEKINLEIPNKSHTLITGPNGSGKSTLLGLIAGIHFSSTGTVVSSSSNFGYIGATPFIFKASLRENLIYGNSKLIDDTYLEDKMREYELFKENKSYDLDRLVTNKSLSSGQMQKIAFIRALLSDIDILLLDESTANLDKHTQSIIFETLAKQDITIINSTHEPENFNDISTHHIKIAVENELRILNFN